VAAAAAPLIAAPGIALANAVGISLMALLLVRDLSRRGVGARLGPLAAHLGRCLAAVAVAVAAGLGARAVYAQVASAPGPGDVAALAVGVLALVLVYWALARLLRVPEASEVVDRSRAAWARLRGASPV
jgi:putative peptidoglycan lipid II flippase